MIDNILSQLDKVRRNRKGFAACCPAHDDREPSLSIAEGDDGRILLHCFAGCTVQGICESLGIEVRDLFTGRQEIDFEKSEFYRKRKLHKKFEILKNQAFLAMADFRSLTIQILDKNGFEIPQDFTKAIHELPMIDHYMQVLATGSNEEQVELLRNGVIQKWSKLYSKKPTSI